MHDVLRGLAAANFHHDGIRSVTLGRIVPATFAGLQHDCDQLVAQAPYRDLSTREYKTGFAVAVADVRHWSLFNRSGLTDDHGDDFDYSAFGLSKKRAHGGTTIVHVAQTIPDLVNLRLAYLGAGAALTVHEEHITRIVGRDKVALRCRFHIPIRSHPSARMMLEGHQYRYEPGFLYAFNNGCVHDARNDSPEPRLHLIFDALLTERTFAVLFGRRRPGWLQGAPVHTEPCGQVPIPEYVPEPGMSETEFDRRELVWHP